MAIEEAVLWVSFVTGILGALGFFWQIFQHLTGRKEERNRKLNRSVLKPWSEVKISSLYDPEQHNRIALVVPKEALPADVAPVTGDRGLEIQRLPGLARGETFLRKQYPRVLSGWREVERLEKKYEALLQRRRKLVEPLVRAGMNESYPDVSPVGPWKDYKMDTYILAYLVADVESAGYWAVRDGEPRLNIQMSKAQADGSLYCEFRMGGNSWLKVADEKVVDGSTLAAQVSSWIADPKVRKANKELFESFEKLEKTIDKFQTALKDASINVELTGE